MCFFANSMCVFMCLHWGEDWVLPDHHKAQIDGVLQWCSPIYTTYRTKTSIDLCFMVVWQYYDHGVQLEWLSGSWSQPNQSPSPSVAQFTWETSSWKSPGCFKLFPLRVTETTCFCDPSMQQNSFLNPSPDVWLDASLFLSSRQFFFFTSGLSFCFEMHYQLVRSFFKMCVPFQIIPIQLNLPHVNFTQSVVTSMLLS